MALVEVKVPQLSESVAEATLLQWKKKPGDAVAIDEILIEVETDKVVLEVPAPALPACWASIVQWRRCQRRQPSSSSRASTPKARPAPPRGGPGCRAAAAPAAAVAAATAAVAGRRRKGGVAMPAAAKLMADHNLPAGSCAGHRQGRPRD
jgi:2-oxoglutarate dehydrogenase E2 component (dihydrolipoamide succinyltransferase)